MIVRSSWWAVAVSFVPRRTRTLPPRSGAIVNPPRLGCAASPPVPDHAPISGRSGAHSGPRTGWLGAAAGWIGAALDWVDAAVGGLAVAAGGAPAAHARTPNDND